MGGGEVAVVTAACATWTSTGPSAFGVGLTLPSLGAVHAVSHSRAATRLEPVRLEPRHRKAGDRCHREVGGSRGGGVGTGGSVHVPGALDGAVAARRDSAPFPAAGPQRVDRYPVGARGACRLDALALDALARDARGPAWRAQQGRFPLPGGAARAAARSGCTGVIAANSQRCLVFRDTNAPSRAVRRRRREARPMTRRAYNEAVRWEAARGGLSFGRRLDLLAADPAPCYCSPAKFPHACNCARR